MPVPPSSPRGPCRHCRAVVDLLVEQPEVDGSVGVVGFCFGGSYSFALALAEPRLRAAIAFYGDFPETGDPATIACPVLAFYGEEDHGITDGVPQLEQRMADAGVDFTARVYHRVGHAFFNDTSPSRYNAEAAVRRVAAQPRLPRAAPLMAGSRSPLVLGPMLRYIGETDATVWVETAEAGVVTVEADGRRVAGADLRRQGSPLRARRRRRAGRR